MCTVHQYSEGLCDKNRENVIGSLIHVHDFLRIVETSIWGGGEEGGWILNGIVHIGTYCAYFTSIQVVDVNRP